MRSGFILGHNEVWQDFVQEQERGSTCDKYVLLNLAD